jgi:hypothetical protein
LRWPDAFLLPVLSFISFLLLVGRPAQADHPNQAAGFIAAFKLGTLKGVLTDEIAGAIEAPLPGGVLAATLNPSAATDGGG